MLGEVIEIAPDVLVCQGENPDNNFFRPVVSNAFVIRQGGNLYVIDTGATKKFREGLIEAVNRLKEGAENLYIIITHAHVDHFSNNDIFNEFDDFKEKKIFVHEAGKLGFDPYEHFLNLFKQVDTYYDIFEGPPPPWRMLTRVMGMFDREKALKKFIKRTLGKYEPINTLPKDVTFLEDEDQEIIDLGPVTVEDLEMTGSAVSIELGSMKIHGWRIGQAIVINDGAHSSGHLLVYFPDLKLIVTGDLTLELFPTWPESSEKKVKEFINWVIELTGEGLVDIMVDSHHKEAFRVPSKVSQSLKEILKSHRIFKESLLSLTKTGEKYTINDLYKGLRKMRFDNEVVDMYLENQFPRSPVFLKTIIANILIQEGFVIEGSGKDANFYKL